MSRSDMSDLEWEFIRCVLPNKSRGVRMRPATLKKRPPALHGPLKRRIIHENPCFGQ
jgi:hypothetical protein